MRGYASGLRYAAAAMAVCLWCAPRAWAVQLLVRPGDEWSHLAAKARPGDEIILMPGTHRPAALDGLSGTATAPIIIRSIDRDHVALIQAEREGLRLRRPNHVVIRDVTISGASVAGLAVTDEPFARGTSRSAEKGRREGAVYGNITLQKVNILKTGPKGKRHAMVLAGLEMVQIQQCAIVGWGGSAIEMTACRNVQVSECTMRGLEDNAQNYGLRVRAGSESVFVDQCRFEQAGAIAVSIGGASRPEEFSLLPDGAPASARAIEASDISIDRTLIHGGDIGIDVNAAQNCRVRGSTIVNSRACLVRAANLQPVRPKPGERAAAGLNLSNNIFLWQAGGIMRLMDLTGNVDKTMVQVEQNLWWSPETEAEKKKRGAVEGTMLFDQVLDVDPMLDSEFKPANSAAELFGIHAP